LFRAFFVCISLTINNSILSSFLNIGNVTVYNGTTIDEDTISLIDADLRQVLNYTELSQETIPLRLGIENTTLNLSIEIDAFSVVDLSGSMHDVCEYSDFGFGFCCASRGYSPIEECQPGFVDGETCSVCSGISPFNWTPKLALAKKRNKFFNRLTIS